MMNSKNWYFLSFASLLAWVYFMSQVFCGIPDAVSGFDLLFNFLMNEGSYIWVADYVAANLAQAGVLTVIFVAISGFAFIRAIKCERVASSIEGK